MGVSGLDNNLLLEMYWENSALKFEVPTQQKQLQTLIKYLLGQVQEIIFIGSIYLFQCVTMLKH
jgi:hypothetical protein